MTSFLASSLIRYLMAGGSVSCLGRQAPEAETLTVATRHELSGVWAQNTQRCDDRDPGIKEVVSSGHNLMNCYCVLSPC